MKIIPAIDIIDGKCVRLEQGVYSKKTIYNENPLEVAKKFEDSGMQDLHLVDLDGAKSDSIINWRVLNTIASKTNLKIDFGGGIKADKDIEIAFDNGALQVTAGSIAVKNKDRVVCWIKKYGKNRIILGADVKDEKIAISGWQETLNIDIIDFLDNYTEVGIEQVICTDIGRDGMLQGTSIGLYEKIINTISDIKLVASGGVADISELDKLIKIGVYGVIVGKAIYENKISLKELRNYVDQENNTLPGH